MHHLGIGVPLNLSFAANRAVKNVANAKPRGQVENPHSWWTLADFYCIQTGSGLSPAMQNYGVEKQFDGRSYPQALSTSGQFLDPKHPMPKLISKWRV
jgi:hypothetical protein